MTDSFYRENTNDLIVTTELFGDEIACFFEGLSWILNTVDSCDTYLINESDSFYDCEGYYGYIVLYNLNRNCVYHLWASDVNEFIDTGKIILEAFEPTEDDMEAFERLFGGNEFTDLRDDLLYD